MIIERHILYDFFMVFFEICEECVLQIASSLNAIDAFHFSLAVAATHKALFIHYCGMKTGKDDEETARALLGLTLSRSHDSCFALLQHDLYVLARDRTECGTKLKLYMYRMYKCKVVSYSPYSVRYHQGVDTIGEYTAKNVSICRIFAKVSGAEREEYDQWRRQDGKKFPMFDDDGSGILIQNLLTDQEACFIPVFGFMDAGNVLARNVQQSIVNPFLSERITKL